MNIKYNLSITDHQNKSYTIINSDLSYLERLKKSYTLKGYKALLSIRNNFQPEQPRQAIRA